MYMDDEGAEGRFLLVVTMFLAVMFLSWYFLTDSREEREKADKLRYTQKIDAMLLHNKELTSHRFSPLRQVAEGCTDGMDYMACFKAQVLQNNLQDSLKEPYQGDLAVFLNKYKSHHLQEILIRDIMAKSEGDLGYKGNKAGLLMHLCLIFKAPCEQYTPFNLEKTLSLDTYPYIIK